MYTHTHNDTFKNQIAAKFGGMIYYNEILAMVFNSPLSINNTSL